MDVTGPGDAPRNVHVTNKTTANRANVSVTLMWKEPSTPNGIIKRYDVEIFVAGTNAIVVQMSSEMEELFIDSKLEKFSWYEARVRAVTIAPGPFSDRILFLTNQDECASSPCQNIGTCTDGVNMYACNCVDGYTGVNCETNIDECASSPCQNGGNCTDGVNMYSCQCATGWKSSQCETGNSYICGCVDHIFM